MVVVGTWNLENLYRPGGEYGPKNEAEYAAKLDSLVVTINGASIDVLAVQEVGSPEALDDLAARLAGDWHTAVSQLPDPRGIRVGFLSQLPMTVIEDVAAFPAALAPLQADDSGAVADRAGRGALAVRVQTGSDVAGGDITLVSCHLKSKLITFPGGRFATDDEAERARYAAYALYRRAAEAVTVRDLANRLMDGQGAEIAVVCMGDLNDGVEAGTTQILHGPPGSELGTSGAFTNDAGDAWRLFNLTPTLPEGAWTRRFRSRGEVIDHILVSRALLRHEMQAWTTVADTGLPSITEDASERRGKPGSDHAMVAVELA